MVDVNWSFVFFLFLLTFQDRQRSFERIDFFFQILTTKLTQITWSVLTPSNQQSVYYEKLITLFSPKSFRYILSYFVQTFLDRTGPSRTHRLS